MHHTLFKTLKNINHLSARGDQRHLSNLSPIFCKFRVDEHSSDLAGIILIGRVASEHKLTLGRDNWVNTTHTSQTRPQSGDGLPVVCPVVNGVDSGAAGGRLAYRLVVQVSTQLNQGFTFGTKWVRLFPMY